MLDAPPALRAGAPARPTLVARANAWFFDTFDELIDRRLREVKAPLLADVPDSVVEIGAGTGANFRYYRPGTRVIAVEPSVAMHDRLRRRADRFGLELEVLAERAEDLSLPEASADLVVSTLVLCSVDDPAAVVAEVRRILRSGGRFAFVEHVIAPVPGPLRAVQRLARRPWARMFDGCDTCRATADVIHASGFSHVQLERRQPFDPVFLPVSHQIYGSAAR